MAFDGYLGDTDSGAIARLPLNAVLCFDLPGRPLWAALVRETTPAAAAPLAALARSCAGRCALAYVVTKAERQICSLRLADLINYASSCFKIVFLADLRGD